MAPHPVQREKSIQARQFAGMIKGITGLKDTVVVLLLVISSIFVYQYIFDKKLDENGDNVTYFLRGKSLANGHGYVVINHPDKMPEATYPPGYPFIISLVIRAAGNDLEAAVLWAKGLNGAMFVGILVLCYFLFRRITNNAALSLSVTALLALNSVLLRSATIMMTEIPYLFTISAAFYFLSRTDLSGRIWRDGWFWLSLLFLVFCYYIRTQGMAVFFGVLVYFIAHKKWKHTGVTFAVLLLQALPWYIWGKIHGGSSYIQALLMVDPYDPAKGTVGALDLVSRFFDNLWRYCTAEVPIACLPSLKLSPYEWSTPGIILSCIFIILISLGIYQTGKYRSLLAGYLVGVFGIILFWPSVCVGPRFISSGIPILVFFCLTGLWAVLSLLRNSIRRSLYISPYFLLVLGLLYLKPVKRMHDDAKLDYVAKWRNYFKVADWVKNNTPPQSVVCCRKPGVFHLFSNRLTKIYPFSREDEDILEDFATYDVDYIVVAKIGFSSTGRYLVPAINENYEMFQKVLHLKNPSTYLFRMFSGKTPLGKARMTAVSFREKAEQARSQGNNRGAIEKYLEIISLFDSSGIDDVVLGYTYNHLGTCYFTERRPDSTVIYFTRAIDNFKRHLGDEDREVGIVSSNLGKLMRDRGAHEEAEKLLLEALDILTGTNQGGADVGQCLHDLGFLYFAQGNLEKAEAYYKRAVDVWKHLSIEYFRMMKIDVHMLYAIYIKSGRELDAHSVYKSFEAHINETFGLNSTKVLSELQFGPGKGPFPDSNKAGK
jgi:tetratricopeptide (TPR) repeat protein